MAKYMDASENEKQLSKIEFLSQFCEDEELFIGKREVSYTALTVGLKANANAIGNCAMVVTSAMSSYVNCSEEQSILKEMIDSLEGKSDYEFFHNMRVTKKTFDYILTIIKEQYTAVYRGGFVPLDPKSALCICLWYLGSKSTYKNIGEIFGIAPSTVFECVQKVVNILCKSTDIFIKWPRDDEITEKEEGFKSIAGIPGVIGAIGKCHIEIRNPSDAHPKYMNKASTHSLLLVAVCDVNKKFMYMHAGIPGSTPEEDVFKSVSLYDKIIDEPHSLFPSMHYHLVGDPAFGLSKYLLVPFTSKENLTAMEESYNAKLVKTLYVIENAFYFLKERFPRMKYVDSDVKRIPQIIKACCVLHNITADVPEEEAFLLNENSIDPFNYPEVIQMEADFPIDTEGYGKRDMIVNML
ncbi:putative nuclease HARBI1 [Penaeus vannamei]|uniref:putative nuclease HARBI1 n=1 Tax=Penaeus vannamei TaxID=6689 RepID=UPI00387F3FA3